MLRNSLKLILKETFNDARKTGSRGTNTDIKPEVYGDFDTWYQQVGIGLVRGVEVQINNMRLLEILGVIIDDMEQSLAAMDKAFANNLWTPNMEIVCKKLSVILKSARDIKKYITGVLDVE